MLPSSHQVPLGDEFYVFDNTVNYSDKGSETSVRLGSLHTLFANAVRTLEDLSSTHNFLTGFSSLAARSLPLANSPDMVQLLQATLLSLQSAIWEGSKSLFNVELLLRSEALDSVSIPDLEARTLRAQPFLRQSLFGPAAAIASAARRLNDQEIRKVQKGSGSSSGKKTNRSSSSYKKKQSHQSSGSPRKNSSSATPHKTNSYSGSGRSANKKKQQHSSKHQPSKKSSYPSKQPKNFYRGSHPKGKGPQ